MERLCDNCIHCYKPTSVKDYFDKTMKMPDLHKWGIDVFKHLFWLCDSEVVSHKDHSDGTMLMKPCFRENFHGYCEEYRTSDAEDIHPSLIFVDAPTEEIRQGDTTTLSVTVTPCTIPAVTKEVPVTVEVELRDENGGLILDEDGNPKYITEEHLETVVVVPEHENDQDITYTYLWYKNNRKLFNETKPTVTIDTSKGAVDVYKCEVTQSIKSNGDGGLKCVSVFSNEIEVTVIGVNTVSLTLKTGTDPTSIPLPIIPSKIKVPMILKNGWTIENVEATEDAVITEDIVDKTSINCTDGINAEFGEGLEIRGESGTVTLKWDNE